MGIPKITGGLVKYAVTALATPASLGSESMHEINESKTTADKIILIILIIFMLS